MKLINRACRGAYRYWDVRIAAFSIPLTMLVTLGLIWLLPPNRWVVPLGLATEGIALIVWRLVTESRTWAGLARQFPHLCGTCGYNICASPSRCPECGSTHAGSGPAAA